MSGGIVEGCIEIVATGARTPVGLTAEDSAAAVRAGIARGREFSFVDPNGEPVIVARDGLLDARVEGRARVQALLESVLDEVARKLGAGEPHRGKTLVLLALPEARPGFPDSDAAAIGDAVRGRLRASLGDAVEVTVAGRGHAGAIRAVEVAAQEAARADETLFLIAAADSYHHIETFMWLESQRRFAQPGVRGGFMPGEGAGCLALATPRLRARLRARPLGVVGRACTAQETRLRTSESGSLGAALSQAVLGATAGLALPADAADSVYVDINGERYRNEEWGFVALKAPAAFKSLRYEAPSDCWGDVGAAFGALAAILAVQSYARGYALGPRSLILAGSDGGLRGALLLKDPRVS